MLRLFRLNDPYRLGLVLLIMVGLRLPHWLSDAPLTWHQQHWLLLGQRLAEGASMYSDMWDTTGPLPSLVYSLLHTMFGWSPLAHEILALLVLFIQCIIFNSTMLSRKAYNENTYIPGLMYGLLGSWFLDFFDFSPLLLGLTFVLLGYQQLFSHLQSRAKEDEAILVMGLMMGLAALCYLPLALLMIPLFLALGLYSSTIPRRYVLIFMGFALPLVMSGVFYYLVGGLGDFISLYLLRPFSLAKEPFASWPLLISILAVPAFLFLIAVLRTLSYPRFINYQSRLQQIMLLWFLVGIVLWLRSYHRSAMHLLVMVPPLAFFFAHYVLLIRKRRWAELAWWFIWVPIVLISLNPVTQWLPFMPGPQSVQVPAVPLPEEHKNRSMWVLGNYPAYYQHASRLGTAFYYWDHYEDLILDLDTYYEIAMLQGAAADPLPEVVVDPEGRFTDLLKYYPEWKATYRPEADSTLWIYRP